MSLPECCRDEALPTASETVAVLHALDCRTSDDCIASREHLGILVAEDPVVDWNLAAERLEGMGHRVTVVASGTETLSALCRGTFDLVLINVQLPKRDGFATVAAVRDAEQVVGGHLPIVAVAAVAAKGDRDRCLRAGFDSFITVPFDGVGLARAIAEACPSEECEAREPATLGPTPATDLIFGRAEALKQLGGDDELLRDIIEIFLSDFPNLLTLARNATARHDPTALMRSAHVLVGTSAQLRATELADAARGLERLGSTGVLEGTDSALAALEEAFDRFRAAVALSAPTHPVTSAPSVDPVEKG